MPYKQNAFDNCKRGNLEYKVDNYEHFRLYKKKFKPNVENQNISYLSKSNLTTELTKYLPISPNCSVCSRNIVPVI